MKKWLFLLTFLILMVGCNQKDISIDYTNLSFNENTESLRLYVGVENQNTEEVDVDIELAHDHHWLNEHIGEIEKVHINHNEVEEHEQLTLESDTMTRFTIFYDWVNSVDSFELKRDLYYEPIQLNISSHGEVIDTESISEISVIDYSDLHNSNNNFARLIFFLLVIVGLSVLIDKGVRKWVGVKKIKRKDQPKAYRWFSNISNVIISSLPIIWFSQSFNPILILYLVIFGIVGDIVLGLIFLRGTREYQVSIINGAIAILFITLFIQYLPYIIYR